MGCAPAHGKPITPAVEDVLDRAAGIPRGLAFLHLAPLESAAIALATDARAVAEVRALLDDPATHALVIGAFKAALARRPPGPPPEHHRAPPPPDMGPEDLVRAAQSHPLGLPFLMDGPLESVAVTFRASPFVVLEARGLLEKRGVGHESE